MLKQNNQSKQIILKPGVASLFLFISGLMIILLSGCGGSSSEDSYKDLNKITDWQNRQLLVKTNIELKIPSELESLSLYDSVCYIIQRLPHIRYERDIDAYNVEDYWETSDEVLHRKASDCEGMAALAFFAISESGILSIYDASIYIRLLDFPETDHAVCIVANDEQVVEISDMWVSDFLTDPDIAKVVCDFDLYSIHWGGIEIN